jgi:hypothetical protein
MLKATTAAVAFAALVALGAGPASAQSLGWFARDPSPALGAAMTEAQARRACQREFRGARESQRALRQKMRTCINMKMQGR